MFDYDVVIIDSGLDINQDLQVSGICIEKSQKDFLISNDLTDRTGHGNIIYSIIVSA